MLAGLEQSRFKAKEIAIFSLAFSSIYAGACEYYQTYVPGRGADALDLLAGIIGAGLGAGFFLLLAHKPKTKILLHICCAGCGAYVAKILEEDYEPVLYFYNPNIYPESEYERRMQEAIRIAKKFGLKIIIHKYNHGLWLNHVEGHEADPEKGQRCQLCFKHRLEETAKVAKKKGFTLFTTTLTVSPHKDAGAISRVGQALEKKYGVKFLNQDFKKMDGFNKSVRLSKELGIYRQNYCGCEFSYHAGDRPE